MKARIHLLLLIGCAAAAVHGAGVAGTPTSRTRWATDAYPGFDRDEASLSLEKKTPRWFSWLNGPAKDNPAEQLAYAEECEKAESWRAARRGYDSLVREWPASPEACIAQEKLAELYLRHYLEYEEAFNEYKYLLDYYTMQCDYDAISTRLWEVAKLMEAEGRRFFFVRFANTIDVRRAYEAVVRRAPGAPFVPDAMLRIGKLREDDGDWDEAAKVYETLRNLHPETPEAQTALYREASVRMHVLRVHEYNRQRCKDTIDFLRLAGEGAKEKQVRAQFAAWLEEAVGKLEDDAFASAKFYDSRTRTKRSAIDAYRKFLKDYPASRHADAARARLAQLEEEERRQ